MKFGLQNDLPFLLSNPGKIMLTAIVLVAIGAVAVVVEEVRSKWLALVVASIILLLMALAIHPAFGHDHDRPDLDGWLQGLHSKNKTWCCNGDDTDAIEDWETKGDRYRVKFRGEWFDVPDNALIDGPNKGGGALLWMNKGYSGMSVRCFMPGSMT